MTHTITRRFDAEKTKTTRSPKGEYAKTQAFEYQIQFLLDPGENTIPTSNDADLAMRTAGFIPGSIISVTAITDANGPIVGGIYGTGTSGSSIYFINELNVERESESPYVFKATVSGLDQSQPAGETPKFNVAIAVDGVEYTDILTVDINNKPIVNSAGVPFPDGLQETKYDEEITIDFDSTAVDGSNIASCRGLCNNASVTFHSCGLNKTVATNTIKLVKARYGTNLPASLATNTAVTPIWHSQYVFHYRKDNWTRNVIDQGYYMRSATGTSVVPITDTNGAAVSTPQLLDGAGGKLASGATAILLHFTTVATVDFSGLLMGL